MHLFISLFVLNLFIHLLLLNNDTSHFFPFLVTLNVRRSLLAYMLAVTIETWTCKYRQAHLINQSRTFGGVLVALRVVGQVAGHFNPDPITPTRPTESRRGKNITYLAIINRKSLLSGFKYDFTLLYLKGININQDNNK